MGWNERSDPDMRTANFKFSCDVYREGVYWDSKIIVYVLKEVKARTAWGQEVKDSKCFKEVSCAHQGSGYLIKYTLKTQYEKLQFKITFVF